jgi:hypothetical protein
MQTFKQFLTEIVDLPLLVKLINNAASQKPRLLLDCFYDGHHHQGFVEEARDQPRRGQEPLFAFVDYRFWSEDEGTYVPATMAIYEEDVAGFYFGKVLDDDGRTLRRALMFRKPDKVTESREVYAKKIADAPAWSPAHAEGNYKVGKVTFSAADGLGAVPFNQSVYYHGLVALVTPSKFEALALSLDASPGAIEGIVEKVEEGYALGIPFLQIDLGDYWKNPKTGLPKVKGHEGRHRVQAFKKMEGDKPLPVHLFLLGGDRNRDLTDDALEAIKDAIISQRGKTVLDPFKQLWKSP